MINMENKKPMLIMTAWNNLALTSIAIDTLIRNTTIPYDLHLINNGSVDGTKEYFDKLCEKGKELNMCEEIKVMHNATNEGNVIPVNRAMQESSPQDVVLLNNDMEFPKGWLKALRDVSYKHENTGIVGVRLCYNPISFNITEKMKEHYTTEQIKHFATFKHTVNLGASWIKRKVIDDIGVLDENFGLGFVEDDDYCLRAALAGYRMDQAPVFIKHVGSATFGSDIFFMQQQFAKNKKYFFNKWVPKGIVPSDTGADRVIRHEIDELKVRNDVIEKKIDKIMEKLGIDSRTEVTY